MKIPIYIKRRFISFLTYEYNHKEIPNSSLVPSKNDPSVLFTTAGMHPIVPYLLGKTHGFGGRLVNVQRCFRTDDIEEVGDTIHHTLFEMLGYWSLGNYSKEESIVITFRFFVDVLKLDPNRLYVTVYEGDKNIPKDINSIVKWQQLFTEKGVECKVWDGTQFYSNTRIFPLIKKENWWGPVGNSGPCGPDSELFYWRGKGKPDFSKFVPWDKSNMFIEISNNVFMEYNQDLSGNYSELKQKNIDFGGGFERIVLVKELQEEDGSVDISKSVYNTSLFKNQQKYIEMLDYESKFELSTVQKRIILDHLRGVTFVLGDGVIPGSKEQGYVVRRLLRRVLSIFTLYKIDTKYIESIVRSYIRTYSSEYNFLKQNKPIIISIVKTEILKFENTIVKGLKEINKLNKKTISGRKLFMLFSSYGFPCELSLELLQIEGIKREKLISDFDSERINHQAISRKGSSFLGGLNAN